MAANVTVDKEKALKGVLESRKFWSCIVGALALVLIHFGIAEIDVNVWVTAIITLVGIYTGSISLEDGLSRLGPTFMTRVAPSLIKMLVKDESLRKVILDLVAQETKPDAS
jgi:hypothetical protein